MSSLYTSLTHNPLHEDKIQLLKWLSYTDVRPFNSLIEWHYFTKRVCFHHSTGSKGHECLLIPSLGALRYHIMLRSEYVFKIIYPSGNHSVIDISKYCWKMDGDKIQVLWDEKEAIKRVVTGKG